MLSPTLESTPAFPQAPCFGAARKKFRDHSFSRPLDRMEKVACAALCEALLVMRRITPYHARVFRALLYDFHNSASGRCFPSYEAIAEKAGCDRKTVCNALRRLEVAGLLTWAHRVVRRGSQVQRSSNSYRFNVPASLKAVPDMAARLARRAVAFSVSAANAAARSRVAKVAASVAANLGFARVPGPSSTAISAVNLSSDLRERLSEPVKLSAAALSKFLRPS